MHVPFSRLLKFCPNVAASSYAGALSTIGRYPSVRAFHMRHVPSMDDVSRASGSVGQKLMRFTDCS